MIVAHVEAMDDWSRIHAADCSLHLDARVQPLDEATIEPLLAKAPFTIRAEGAVRELSTQLTELPRALVEDVLTLAERFAGIMSVGDVRIRVEGITGNACTKVHADFTDVRLITTYAGPGTDYAPAGDAGCCLERVPTGWVGLFKGNSYATGHTPCLHRSPPVAETGERRLVLVIDTPFKS